jgi:hypothetical protein
MEDGGSFKDLNLKRAKVAAETSSENAVQIGVR